MANNQVPPAGGQKPKILIFSAAYLPLVGGAEIAVKEITQSLPYYQFDMVVAKIKPGLAKFEKIGNINVYRVGWGINWDKYLLPFWGLWQAGRLERKNHYQIAWSIMASFGGFLGLFFKYLHPAKPWLLTLQEGDDPTEILKKVGVFRPLFRQIFCRADYIQAISGYLSDWAKKRMKTKSPIEIIPNGVDLKIFQRQSQSIIEELKSNLGIKPTEKVILTVSRLVKKNGVADLIKAGQRLGFPFKVLIVGRGKEESELKKLAEKLRLKEKVLFLGQIAFEDLSKYYSLADIFVRPSLSEGFGNVFLEALACGTPVVGTAVGGSAIRILSENQAGLICQAGNSRDIAEKIKAVLSNNADQMVRNGQEIIKKEYTWEIIASKMEKIFEKISYPRILIAAEIFPPEIGGPAIYSKVIAEEFRKQGIKTAVICYSDNLSEKGDFSVFRISKKHFLPLKYFLYFLKILDIGWQYDLIYAQGPVSSGLPVWLAAPLLRKKFAVKITGDYAWEQARNKGGYAGRIDDFQKIEPVGKIKWLKKIEKRVCQKADLVIAPSQYLKKMISGWGIKENKIKVIYNAFGKVEIDLAGIGKRDNSLILSAGRLVPWKGFSALINLMPKLLEINPRFRLAILGDGPQKKKLEDLIGELNLRDKVFILSASREDVFNYLKRAGVFILNSDYEGLSHIILEAIFLGTPVIASKVGGNPEIIKDNFNGFLVEYNNQEQIKKAILEIYQNKKIRQTFADNSQEAIKKFDLDRMIKETLLVFEKL